MTERFSIDWSENKILDNETHERFSIIGANRMLNRQHNLINELQMQLNKIPKKIKEVWLE